MSTAFYDASAIKRNRRTNADLDVIHTAITDLLAEWAPMTIRQIYYRLVSLGYIRKTQNDYQFIGRECLKLRRAGVVSYDDIADGTRWMRKPTTYANVQEAVTSAIANYRRSIWDNQPELIEVWCEKDALADVFLKVTGRFDVPLYVSRGFSSESYLYSAAQLILTHDKPVHILILTDHDAAGINIAEDVAQKIKGFLPDGWEHWVERLAVTDDQIDDFNLLTRDPKPSDIKAGITRCVELDAIDPRNLSQLLFRAIVDRLDIDALNATQLAETQERDRSRANKGPLLALLSEGVAA